MIKSNKFFLACLLLIVGFGASFTIGCSEEGEKASSELEPGKPTPIDKTPGSDKNMGALYSVVWDTSWNLSKCNSNVLVFKVDADGEVSLLTPPKTSSSLNIFVLPTVADASCMIGKYKFVYLPSTLRSILATTDLGCTASTCWEYANKSVSTYASGSNEPAGGETWIKRAGSRYAFITITASTPVQPQSIAFKSGSALASFTLATKSLAVQAVVQQGGNPKSGVSVIYTIDCPRSASITSNIVLPTATSDSNGLAKATKSMAYMDNIGNMVTPIDAVVLPTCQVSATINGGAAVIIIAKQPRPTQTGLALRVNWAYPANMDNCGAGKKATGGTGVTIIGLGSDGRLRRVYNSGMPNEGDVNLLLLPITNTNPSCQIGGITYQIDTDTFDQGTSAANMGCNANNCWQYFNDSVTHRLVEYKAGEYTPDDGERWIKKTGTRYVFHIVQP